ncbi:cadherin-related family member 3-like [Myotis myotis]|uniref:cadherin-related family member 3-like n=1 Tax=Myotis myotis TaxID=51298 RepID=UPI00174CBE1A|nr:cadherin-related family member 3-like [Myotis myotis]
MPFFHLLLLLAAAPDVLAFPDFVIENGSPVLENVSEHTRVAIITVSVSPPASLIGDPVIINADPVVHPFVLSRRSTHQWELLTTGVPKLDFETVTLYSLIIYAKDSHGVTASQTILIQIADVNEPPTFRGALAQRDQGTELSSWGKKGPLVTEIYILEDTAPGTVIYRAAAADPEDAVLESYVLHQSAFLEKQSDRQALTIHLPLNLIRRVSRLRKLRMALSCLKPIHISAKIKPLRHPALLMCPHSHNAVLTRSYHLLCICHQFSALRGRRLRFSLAIKVVDPGGLFAAGNLKIFLINVNNKDPVLTCSLFSIENDALSVTSINSTLHSEVNITLDEEIPIGKTIGVCQATDEDNLGDLTFELAPWNVYFAIDKEHGTVVTTARLDVERAGFARVQSFSIKACDQGQRCAALPVTVYVHGINDNSPFCDQYLIRYTGKEVIANNTVVSKLLCHDLDEPPDMIHYAPRSGPVGPGQLFRQVPKAENCVQVAKAMDYEDPEMIAAGHTYEMTISVFDDPHPSHTVTVTIIVQIAPANDFSPVFKAAHYAFSVPETAGAFYKVGRVTATDEDYPPNCVTYKIASGDTQVIQRFWIHPLSGMIELTTQPDYETVKQYNLTVEGVDCDRLHPRTAMTMVTVDIEDENDEAPVCTPSLYKAVIFDNVVAGTNVNGFKLNCHDRDSQDFEMRFEIVSGNENHHFGFDPTRGSNTPKLIVKNPFHFESGAELQRQYHLMVHIIDDNLKYGKATKPRTGTAIIDIYVARANVPPPATTSSEVKSYGF